MRWFTLLAAIALILSACSGAESTPTTAPETTTTTTAASPTTGDASPAATTEVTTEAPASDTTAPPTTVEPSTTTTTTEVRPLFLAGLDRIDIVSGLSDGGPHAEVAWSDPADAEHFALYLYDPDGDLYWSWQGRETAVPVGGRPQLADDAAGPRLIDGMTVAIVGLDGDLAPVASSPRMPIAP